MSLVDDILNGKVINGRVTSQSDANNVTCLQQIERIKRLIREYNATYNQLRSEWDLIADDVATFNILLTEINNTVQDIEDDYVTLMAEFQTTTENVNTALSQATEAINTANSNNTVVTEQVAENQQILTNIQSIENNIWNFYPSRMVRASVEELTTGGCVIKSPNMIYARVLIAGMGSVGDTIEFTEYNSHNVLQLTDANNVYMVEIFEFGSYRIYKVISASLPSTLVDTQVKTFFIDDAPNETINLRVLSDAGTPVVYYLQPIEEA